MSRRFVITHPELGIYLGNMWGLGFWSMLDCAGQEMAATFETVTQARHHADAFNASITGYAFEAVECSHDYFATPQELDAAGLEHYTPKMKDEQLRNMPTAGAA